MQHHKRLIEKLLSGSSIQINGKKPYDLQVHNQAFYSRVLREPSLGLGESYMNGWWDAEQLDTFFYELFIANIEQKIAKSLKLKLQLLKANLFNYQTKSSSKKAIKSHYDIGNDLFENMLDPLMLYSCAYWNGAGSLAKAQENKAKLICEKLQLKPGETLLDIGCGWGGFAYYAAKNYGVNVIGVTLSEAQKKIAEQWCEGLNVKIELKDYRDINKKFDKIVSIGMFEHVGHKNYGVFADKIQASLKKSGVCLLHFIGGNQSDVMADPWIDKYIFPGGQIPSLVQFSKAIEKKLVVEDLHNIGPHYDNTLMAWQHNFKKSWKTLKTRYTEKFYRMWNYYLASSAASFRAKRLHLWQIVLTRQENPNTYHSIRF